jgi:hypothetical protein
MKVLMIGLFFCVTNFLHAQNNVGVGTSVPTEKLDVNGNVNVTGVLKTSGNAGSTGQYLSTNGSTMNWMTVETIYKINAANYLATSVPQNNYVRIDGSITLTADYSGLINPKLNIIGGSITGNGVTVFNIGFSTTIHNTAFNNVDINGSNLTFINCSFSGICPRIGSNASFLNCSFSSVTISTGRLGVLDNCNVNSSDIPRVNEIKNSEIITTVIGNGITNQNGINTISNNTILSSTIYALQSELVFTGNRCRNTKINVGNAVQFPSVVNISNNQFNSVLTSETSAIEINPTTSAFKVCSIQGNNFLMQSADFSSIRIFGTEGNSLGYSIASIQNNVFWRGSNTLAYSGNMKVLYSGNTILSAGGTGGHPGLSGNLQVTNNFTL